LISVSLWRVRVCACARVRSARISRGPSMLRSSFSGELEPRIPGTREGGTDVSSVSFVRPKEDRGRIAGVEPAPSSPSQPYGARRLGGDLVLQKLYWVPPGPSHSAGVLAAHLSNSMPESGLRPRSTGLRKLVAGQEQGCSGPEEPLSPRSRCSLSSASKQCSCCMKWKLGATLDLRLRTRLNASLRLRLHLCMRYATVIVTEREMPARQCTRTPLSELRASSVTMPRVLPVSRGLKFLLILALLEL
jgi:hypothetical protein